MFPAHGVVSLDPEEQLLHQPQEIGRCLTCWARCGLYVVRSRHVVLCAPCTLERIERLPRPLPEWLAILKGEVRREARHLERLDAEVFTVSWEELVRCDSCTGLVLLCDVRYRFNAGIGRPLCPSCFAAPAG